MDPTAFVIPCLLAGVALYALTRRVDVYAALTQGAGEGLTVVAKILPALVGLLTAVYMLRASGAMDALAAALAPVLGLRGSRRRRRRCCWCGRSAVPGLWRWAARSWSSTARTPPWAARRQ
ncbi:MAG: hypothetical protein ACLUS6_01405 [Dysosmobacter sp.]